MPLSLTKADLLLDQDLKTKEEVMDLLGQKMQELGLVSEGYAESMKRREADISVNLGGGVAIPHAERTDMGLIKKTGVVALTLRNAVPWGEEEPVWIAFGIAANGMEHMEILRSITRLVTGGEEAMKQVVADKTGEALLKFFAPK